MTAESIDRKLLLPHGESNMAHYDLNRVDENTSLTYKFKIQQYVSLKQADRCYRGLPKHLHAVYSALHRL